MDAYYEIVRMQKLNPVFAKDKFNNEVHGTVSVDAYVIRLRLVAGDCSFAMRDNMIRDTLVVGSNSSKI